ncbi:hypothetical protein HPO96_20850 [Kribbella sandramycini]|uniref:Uncharacterized membrane protein YhaH (DUF805 family) n=1 Tax=Kribbella sandramycini TaxID=60450 RepID=A0A7Y4L1M6_9ACTN|nr:hypothetical protein [Kribbella sandramycini]MBB6566648.1 uncharacterized membrane protein YhaH (DUF805 family) [Kribbella sandramycini]NOL42699.1 hypothetical protein [Kribbella sandramycini]
MKTLSQHFPAAAGALELKDYLSATWGDAVLLPISLASLTFAYRTLPSTPHDGRWFLITATGGAIAAALTQLQWLLDDDPQLNWTLPAPHTFNAAGIYHAVFLTASAATFAGLWAVTLRRWADSQLTNRQPATALVLAFLSSLAFAALLIIDNHLTTDRRSSASTLLAIGGSVLIATLGLGIVAARRFKDRHTGQQ